MNALLNESGIEQATLSWFADLGYEVRHGEQIAPEEPGAERVSYGDVALVGRLGDAINRLNPYTPTSARAEAQREVLRPESPSAALQIS